MQFERKVTIGKIESGRLCKILKNFDESKAPGVDDFSGIFLKDGAS